MTGSESLIHNPAEPIPTNGGGNLFEACGPLDQAALEAERVAKGDMLLFTSEVLQKPLPVTGKPRDPVSLLCTSGYTYFVVQAHFSQTSSCHPTAPTQMSW